MVVAVPDPRRRFPLVRSLLVAAVVTVAVLWAGGESSLLGGGTNSASNHASLSGTVVIDSGSARLGARPQADRHQPVIIRGRTADGQLLHRQVTTDSNGRFHLVIPAGQYRLVVPTAGQSSPGTAITIRSGSSARSRIVINYP